MRTLAREERQSAKGALSKRWTVERHDNEDGSIVYEIWTVDYEHRICRIGDDDNRCARRDTAHIVALHNNSLGVSA